jgi:hypothetical protein
MKRDYHYRRNADVRLRELERAWASTGDEAAGEALFRELARTGKWAASTWPRLFRMLLDQGRDQEMIAAVRERVGVDHAVGTIDEGTTQVPYALRSPSAARKGHTFPSDLAPWETAEVPYVLLRAFFMGYPGRVEADGSRRFHVVATRVRGQKPFSLWHAVDLHGAVSVPGEQYVLASITGPSSKKFAGKVLKSISPTPIDWRNYSSARIMGHRIYKKRYRDRLGRTRYSDKYYWKNPDVDLRELERRAVAGDIEAARALTRARERAGDMPVRSWLREVIEAIKESHAYYPDREEDPGKEVYRDYSGGAPYMTILRALDAHGGAEGSFEQGAAARGEWRRQWHWGDERYCQAWVSLPSLAKVSVTEGDLVVTLYGSLQDLLDGVDETDKWWEKHYEGYAWAPKVCPRCGGPEVVCPESCLPQEQCGCCERIGCTRGLIWEGGEELQLGDNRMPHLVGDRQAILERLQPELA